MSRKKTLAIVTRRVKFKDSDKVVSFITKDFGRLSVIAKGVRKTTSRLAAGIEPFTVVKIEFINGRSNLATLVSAKPQQQFSGLSTDYDRAVLAAELLKLMDQLIEDTAEVDYFELAQELLSSLSDGLDSEVVEVWFRLNLLRLLGREPELLKDNRSKVLDAKKLYHFDTSDGMFVESPTGSFAAEQIKGWRILMIKNPHQSTRVTGLNQAISGTAKSIELFMAENSF